MKRFIAVLLAFTLFIALVAFGICYAIDPYSVFHPFSIRDNGVEANSNYIKMTYILKNPDKFDSFLFGSSRAGFLNVEKMGEHCYNMWYPQGMPGEHLNNLKTMLSKGIVPKRVFIALDSASYMNDPSLHESMQTYAPYEYLKSHPVKFITMYLDPAVALQSLPVINSHTPNESYAECFYETGAQISYGEVGTHSFEDSPYVGPTFMMDECLETVREIAGLCNENGIELIVFTNPMHYATYEFSLELDYIDFLRRLAEITPYWNFSGYNDITRNSDYYRDPSHFLPEVGDMMIDCMLNGTQIDGLYDQGFGVYITNENAEQWIQVIEAAEK